MQDPIRVNIIGADFKVQYSVVIVGQLPEKAKKALQNGRPDEATMKPVFGPRWREKLFLAPRKSGGGDEPEEEFAPTDEEISLEDLTNFAQDAPPSTEPAVKPVAGSTIYSFIDIFPFDTILEVKRKLAHITGIPIFRQHLNYYYNKKYYACNYTILYKRLVYHPDIFDLRGSDKSLVEGIPVDQKFINLAKFLHVKAYDFANVMQELMAKFGAFEYNLFDLTSFLTPKTRAMFAKSANNTQLTILYYGFVLIYFPMFTFPVFGDYIKLSDSEFAVRYPQFFNDSDYGRFLALESSLTYQNFALVSTPSQQKAVMAKTLSGIEKATIQVFSNYKDDVVVHIRSLFDVIELNESIIACATTLLNEGSRYFLSKTYKKNAPFKLMPDINNIIFRIKYNAQTTESFTLTLNRNGNYFIVSSFLEEHLFGFADIVRVLADIVNPMIDRINGALAKFTMIGSNQLERMTYENSRFIEVKSFIIWKGIVSDDNFNHYTSIMSDFNRAQIVTLVETSATLNKYYYNKGIYQLDINRIEKNIDINNHYGFLTDPVHKHVFDNLFRHNRIIYVENRSFDMRISIEGLRDKEYNIYQSYIYLSLFLFMNSANFSTGEQKTDRPIKNVRSLKSQDPILYGFKKLYNSPIPYSKICQKPFQPIILPAGDKRPATKFWNFTTKSEAYYHCPNPKYPNMTFIVGKHPKGYCIPCCKKIPISDVSSKSAVYKVCMEKYEYKDERVKKEARYVPNYGKAVEVGRLAHLPEPLRQIFGSTYVTVAPIEDGLDLFVYGVPQSVSGARAAILSILILVMERHMADLIEDIARAIKKKPEVFSILLGGKIYLYFASAPELVAGLFDVFGGQQLGYDHVPWNDIFREIAFYYLGVNIVMFTDTGEQNLVMEVIPNIISDIDIRSVDRHVLALSHLGAINPIFLLNTGFYYNQGIINKKVFSPNDVVVDVVAHMMNYHHRNSVHQNEAIELDDLYRFNDYSKDFCIKSVFISKTNMCYMVHIVKGKRDVYVPVVYIYYNISGRFDIIYDPFSRKKYPNDFATLNDFLYDYNKWAVAENRKHSRHIEYKCIMVDHWLTLKGADVIGFSCKRLNFYVQTDIKSATKLKAAPMVEVLYEPDVVNKVVFEEPRPIADDRSLNLYRNLYHYHGYELFVSELMYYFHTKHNQPIRKIIAEQIEAHNQKALDVIYERLLDMYMKFYSSRGDKGFNAKVFEHIQLKDIRLAKINKLTEIDVEVFNRFKIFLSNDINRLELQLNSYFEEHISKAELFAVIERTDYTFDFTDIHLLKNLPSAAAIKILDKIAENVFTVRDKIQPTKDRLFPNMFISCRSKGGEDYCDRGKLIVEKARYRDFLEIFLQDIQNPLKEQWIINMLYKDNVFDFFEFNYRESENIDIMAA